LGSGSCSGFFGLGAGFCFGSFFIFKLGQFWFLISGNVRFCFQHQKYQNGQCKKKRKKKEEKHT
jgi:hypothetical protein